MCPPSHLIFTDILSRRTAYGLIWLGLYHHRPCVIKMIMLTTGIHYDKVNRQYRSGDQSPMTESDAEHYFDHNHVIPFNHTDFRHRRSMTPDDFFKEVDDQIIMEQLNLAPKVYGYGLNREHDIHYGFIVMEKIDCSLKDILSGGVEKCETFSTKTEVSKTSNYRLNSREIQIITRLINDLHQYGMVHGDLKPSNIGVSLNSNGHIRSACFFDCQKIKYRGDCDDNCSDNNHDDSVYTPHEFTKMAKREIDHFQKYMTELSPETNWIEDP